MWTFILVFELGLLLLLGAAWYIRRRSDDDDRAQQRAAILQEHERAERRARYLTEKATQYLLDNARQRTNRSR
jgi:hypothetical protein